MTDDLLRRAAERAGEDAFFLASLLLPYARAEGLDDAALAARLGCPSAALPRLLLCRRPRQDPAGFRDDVERIAAAFDLDPGNLAASLRLAEALEALRAAGPAGAEGWLAAARDREQEEEEGG